MKVEKYPVISENGKKYRVKIVHFRNSSGGSYLTCSIYKRFIPIPLYTIEQSRILVTDLKVFVKNTVETYEYIKGYGLTIHSKLDEFKDWDGDLRNYKEWGIDD